MANVIRFTSDGSKPGDVKPHFPEDIANVLNGLEVAGMGMNSDQKVVFDATLVAVAYSFGVTVEFPADAAGQRGSGA